MRVSGILIVRVPEFTVRVSGILIVRVPEFTVREWNTNCACP